jgi:hypothetical protein
VVLVLVVLLACPVFVMKATVDPFYRDKYEQEQLGRKLAEQDAAHTKVALTLAVTEREAAVQRAVAAETRLVDDVNNLAADKADVENRLAAMGTAVAQLTARLQAAQSISQSSVARASGLDEQAGKDRARISLLIQAKAQLEADVRTAHGLLESARKQLYAAQEDLADKERVIARGKTTGTKSGVAATPSDISAAVVAVGKAGFISIDVGSARGIHRGMKLVIHRDGRFLGRLWITLVSPDDSAGDVIDKRGNVKPGDRVSSEAKFKTVGG